MIGVPVGLSGIIMMPLIGMYLPRLDKRFSASCGLALIAAGLYWMSTLNMDTTLFGFMEPRMLQGLGMPLFFLSLQQIMFSDVAENELASAAGLSNFFRTIAVSVTTAVSVYGWTKRSEYHASALSGQVLDDQRWAEWSQSAANNGISDSGAMAMAHQAVQAQAATLGINDVLLACSVLILLLIGVLWLARPPFDSKGAPPAH
jgi:DHA2 family multidrug resistance protein